jgi:hypothetical protein
MTGMTIHAFILLHDVLFVGQQQRTGRIRPFSILYWQYHGIKAFMLDFWMYPYSVQQSYQQNVEASSEKVEEASIN